MKFLRQFMLILIAYFLGEALHLWLSVPIPGNVLGMIILFFALYSGVINVKHIEEVGEFLLSHLSFFFIPAGVGLVTTFTILKGNWFPILSICILSTAIVLVTTGITIKLLKRRSKQ